jgi:hypothetical protein
LRLLLGNLLSLDGSCEFGREGKVLRDVSQMLLFKYAIICLQLEIRRRGEC